MSYLPIGPKSSAFSVPVVPASDRDLAPHSVAFAGGETKQVIWTPASGKKCVPVLWIVSFATGGIVTVFDGETNDVAHRLFQLSCAENGGMIAPFSLPAPSAAANNKLYYTTDATAVGSLTVYGYEA